MKNNIKLNGYLALLIALLLLSGTSAFSQFAADVDGKLDVAPINGNLSYTYPISNNSIDGFPLKVDLSFTNNLACVVLAGYYNDTTFNTDAWSLMALNYPGWIIGVNGFAINVLTDKNSFMKLHSNYSLEKPLTSMTEDTSWIPLVEGYDFCNRMQTLKEENKQDIIKLLRSDGSILELRNPKRRIDVEDDNSDSLYIGYYYENSINPEGFAVVSYDSTYWPSYYREKTNWQSDRNSYKPRVIRYYKGDGLEYVFREITTPYGLRVYDNTVSTLDDKVMPGNVSPTIFYLEEINSDMRNLARFKRQWHNRKDDTVEIVRGRAYITEFAGMNIKISESELLFQQHDRTIRCPLKNNFSFYQQKIEHTIFKDVNNEIKTKYTPQEQNVDWVFRYISEIHDPKDRITKFTYSFDFDSGGTGASKIYTNFSAPFSNFQYVSSGLEQIIEPTNKVKIEYYGISKNEIGVIYVDKNRVGQGNLSVSNYSCVKKLEKYEIINKQTSGPLMLRSDYLLDTLNTDFRTNTIISYDSVVNQRDTTVYYYYPHKVSPYRYNSTQSYYTPDASTMLPEKIEKKFFDRKIVKQTYYQSSNSIGGNSRFYWLPVADSTKTIYSDGQTVYNSKKINRYEFTQINDFGGNTELATAYGQGISKSTEIILNPVTSDSLLKTETNYMHLGLYNSGNSKTDTIWNKYKSIRETDSLRYLNEQSTTAIKFDEVFTPVWVLSPIWNIPLREIVRDGHDTILGGKSYNYNTWYIGGNRRGALISDSIISKYGSETRFNIRYNYSGGMRRNLLTSTENLLGVVNRQYYSYWDVSDLNNSYPSGKVLYNDDGITDTSLYHDFYEFETPVASESHIRKWGIGGYYTDIFRTYFEKTYYGQNSGMIDNNGWFWGSEYDENGRITYTWHPFDFPPCSGGSLGTIVTELPVFTKLTQERKRNDNISLESQTITHPGTRIWDTTFTEDYLRAGNRFDNLVQFGNGTGTGDVSQVYTENTAHFEYRASNSDPFHNGSTVTDAYLRLVYSGSYAGECMTLKITGDKFGIEKRIMIGCPALQLLPDTLTYGVANGIPMLKINLTPYIDSLAGMSAGQSLKFEVKSLSMGGEVDFVHISDDQSVKIVATHSGCDPHKDYTAKFSYDDSARTTTYSSKIDDFLHTNSKGWQKTYYDNDGRYTGEIKFFGANNRLLKQRSIIGSPAAPVRNDEVEFSLSGKSQVLRTKDQELNIFKNSYRDDGEIDSLIAPDGSAKIFKTVLTADTIDGQDYYGFISTKISYDENHKKNVEYYDALGMLRKKVVDFDDLKYTTKYEYDLMGNLKEVTHPDNQKTYYFYDNFYRLKYKVNSNTDTISYRYDISGQLRFSQTKEQAKQNKVSYLEYDDLGRMIVSGEATLDTMLSDFRNSPVRLTDTLNPDKLNYNGFNTSTDLLTVNKTLWSLSNVNMPAFWSLDSLVSTLSFPVLSDTLENLIPGTYLMHPVNYYDTNKDTIAIKQNFENIAQHPQFVRVVNHYDTLPDRTGAIWSNFPEKALWDSIAPYHSWDRGARTPRNLRGKKAATAYRDKSNEPFHYVVMSYDPRGRTQALLRYTENLGFDAVYYTYNSANQVLNIRVVEPLRQYVTWYGYDNNGRVDSIWTALSHDSTGLGISTLRLPPCPVRPDTADIVYSYDKRGNVDTLRFVPAHSMQFFRYNPRGWLDSMVAKDNIDTLFFRQRFVRDTTGNILSQISQQKGKGELTQNYYYDRVYRMTGWNDGTDSLSWTYDAKGNRQRQVKNLTDTTFYNYSFNNLPDRLASTTEGNNNKYYSYNNIGSVNFIASLNGTDSVMAETFGYSGNGRLKQFIKKEYGSAPMLCPGPSQPFTRLNNKQFDWRYRYAASGGREQKRLYYSQFGDSACGLTNYYHSWTYYLVGAAGEQLAVYKGVQVASDDTSMHTGRRVYMYPHSYITRGGTMVMMKDSTKEFNVMDNLGSVRSMISVKNYEVTSQGFDYKPFGDTLNADGEERIGFVSQERDEESRYINMGARLYDPIIGRFLQVDPYFEMFNFYSPYQYSFNNPVSFKDPTGYEPDGEKGRDKMLYMALEDIDACMAILKEMDKEGQYCRAVMQDIIAGSEAAAESFIMRHDIANTDPKELPKRIFFITRGAVRAVVNDDGTVTYYMNGIKVKTVLTTKSDENKKANDDLLASNKNSQTTKKTGTPWMDVAKKELGVQEIPGSENNERILEYQESTTRDPKNDEVPWCSSFMNWAFFQADILGTGSALAFSWNNWGENLDDPVYGAVIVLQNSHVTFFAGYDGNDNTRFWGLGGNQNDMVKYSRYFMSSIMSIRYPFGYLPDYLNIPVFKKPRR